MARVSRQQMLMEMAEVVAKRGTCSRLQVGAVFARDGRIIVTGYNGAPAGMPHCDHSHDSPIPQEDFRPGEVVEFSVRPENLIVIPAQREEGCTTAEHAERNAIAFAARHGLALDGSDLYCTDAPCLACARSIINAGVRKVFFLRPYRITAGVELLREADLGVIDMSAWA